MRARVAQTVVETSVGDVKVQKVICLCRRRFSRTEEEKETKVLVRKKSEQREDFMRVEGGRMGANSQVRARGGKQKHRTRRAAEGEQQAGAMHRLSHLCKP